MQNQQVRMLLIAAFLLASTKCQWSSSELDERTSEGVECSVCRCDWDNGQTLFCQTSNLNATDPFRNFPELPDVVSVEVYGDTLESSGPLAWPQDGDLVKHFPNVRSLEFSDCTFETIGKDFLDGLSSLRSLTFTGNRLREVPAEALAPIAGFLKELEISFQSELTEIREGDFCGFSNLSTLRLSRNGIYHLHVNSIVELIELNILSLDRNNLTDIPNHSFNTLTKLETLDLSFNSLPKIPRAIDVLKNLHKLDLSFNQISDTGDLLFIFGMPYLYSLSLQYNLISTIDSDVINAIVFNYSVSELKLCSNPFHCDLRLCDGILSWYDYPLFSPPNMNLWLFELKCEYKCTSPLQYWDEPFGSVYQDVCVNNSNRTDFNFTTTQTSVPLLVKRNNNRIRAIGAGVGVLALAVVIFGVVVFIRLRRLRLMRGGFIFAGRGLLRPNRNDGQEEHLVYDALVYHHNDEVEFVDDRLRPRLENHPNNLRLCLPLIRDFRLGAKRLNSLRESLVASRCAVFVISEAFVLDARCRQALEVACDYLHRDDLGPPHIKQTGLILILLDPVLLETLPEAIRVLVDRLITLEWNNLDEERCWRRLEQSLHDFGRQVENEV
ncbi:uncharacterized protein [Diadema setosum]|uniref:uncharacterized protein n=1 Tax=Diadema setosum TaxID=31175 RepID=UPI003B3AF8E6